MFKRALQIGTIAGFKIRLDASWIIIAVLVSWSLAAGWFPALYPGLPGSAHLLMGIVGALGLFTSVVVHELAHAVVGRHYGVDTEDIVLFIFGGVAEIKDEPPRAGAEFAIAIVGPLTSLGIGLLFFGLNAGAVALTVPVTITGILSYLAVINIVLAVFNMLPAFPLDGGRVLRAILWKLRGNLRQATRFASRVGSGFALLLIALGIVSIFRGYAGGIWYALIGLFLQNAASLSYKQLLLREELEGHALADYVRTEPVTVEPDITVDEFVHKYLEHYQLQVYPVVERDALLGYVGVREVTALPRELWNNRKVWDIMIERSPENTISDEVDAFEAFTKMKDLQREQLLVSSNGSLAGTVSLDDLVRASEVRLQLEGEQM
jgi:Zn-dependent protease/CBS domain-containing protein